MILSLQTILASVTAGDGRQERLAPGPLRQCVGNGACSFSNRDAAIRFEVTRVIGMHQRGQVCDVGDTRVSCLILED